MPFPRLTVSPARLLLPMGVAVCLSPLGDLALYAVLVNQREVVGLTLASVGVMLGVNRLIRIPGNPLAGALVDRCGRRALFVLGLLVGALSTAGYALWRGFWPFLASRLAWGLAWSLINVAGMAMVVDVSSDQDRGRWMGVYQAWVLVGLALGPVVGGLLVDAVGFEGAMLACSAITGFGLVVALVAMPETAPAQRASPAVGPGTGASAHRPIGPGRRLQARAWLRANPGLASALALYLIAQFAGEGVLLSTLSLLLARRLGQAVAIGTLALGVASAGGLILGLRSLLAGAVGPLAGRLADGRVGRWGVVGGSLVAGAAGFALLAYATAWEPVLAGVIMGAVSAGAGLAVLPALVGDLSPAGKEGLVMGAYATAGDAGSAAGPLVAFALASRWDLRWVYLLCSLGFLLGLGLVGIGWRAGRLGRPAASPPPA